MGAAGNESSRIQFSWCAAWAELPLADGVFLLDQVRVDGTPSRTSNAADEPAAASRQSDKEGNNERIEIRRIPNRWVAEHR